jgi:hypothetical protein
MYSNKKDKKIKTIEKGDVFFFYRRKVGSENVNDLEDVQRFYMVLVPNLDENKDKNNQKSLFRLFLLGRKKLPDIVKGKSISTERNWALNILTTSDLKEIENELLITGEYETETRGKRKLPSAVPTGEGKYHLVKHDNHTEFAYILELPGKIGQSQEEFEIKKEASYIISVKNPDINIRGFSYFAKEKPRYPQKLKELFGDRRWINIENQDLINYKNIQILLIGARKEDIENELGIEIDEKKENENTSDLIKKLHIDKEKIPLNPLFAGKFPSKQEVSDYKSLQQVKHIPKHKAPGKGGKKGGTVSSTYTVSASSIAKILEGIDLPKNRNGLVRHAVKNKSKSSRSKDIIELLKELPKNISFKTMADIEKAIGNIR